MLPSIGGDDGIGDGVMDDIGDTDMPDGVFGEDSVGDVSDGFGFEGLRIFTLRGIVAFFVVFGWVGVVMDSGGAPIFATLAVAAVCGFAIMLALAFIFRAILRLRSDAVI